MFHNGCIMTNRPSNILRDGSSSNNRNYLLDVVRSTLSGNPLPDSYWRKEMYEHFQNEGSTPFRSFENTGITDSRHHPISYNNQAQNEIIIVDVSDSEEPGSYSHQNQAYRSIPSVSSSSSSDETEESTSSDSSTKPDPMVESQETRERKRELVNKLMCKEASHYYCRACSYASYDQSRVRIHIESVHFVGKRIQCKCCNKYYKNIANANSHWYRHHYTQQQKANTGARQFLSPPPLSTPQTTSRPIKERWIVGETDERQNPINVRRNSVEKVIAF